jgi:multidrug efflux pump subunit AcrB
MDIERLKELKFTTWCINNKTSIYVITLIITIAGLVTYNKLPKELFPDVVVPTISVATIYPGATPEDIENLVTKPLEKQMKSLNGVKKVTSTSMSDFSLIVVEFNTDLLPKDCKQKVTDAVGKGKKDLPTDLKSDPQIQEFDISELPIMNINLAGNIPLDQLKKQAEDLKNKIESLNGITRVDIVGGLEREIQVEIDLYKMTSVGLTLLDIENAISRQNMNISGGEMQIGELKRNVRITGEFEDPKEIEDMVLRSFMGNSVFVKDIATVTDGYKERSDFARLDGKSVITLNVIKRSGANLIDCADNINVILDESRKTDFPKGMTDTITGDTSGKTRLQLHDLINTVILGFVFVVFVLMFFMGFTNAFFVGLAVPLSCMIAFLLMPTLGMTMNVIVLFSFLLALGIIVDDAVVVIENTHRIFNSYDYSIKDAAKYAAGEVFIPVLAGTLTTLAPFVPLLFWPGIIGKFMHHLPVTLIITLGASLVVAFVMNPVFAVTFMTKDHDADGKLMQRKGFFAANKYGFIVFGLVAIISYIKEWYGVANFSVFMILLIIIFHFVFSKAIVAWQTKIWPSFIASYKNLLSKLVIGFRPALMLVATVVMLVLSIVIFMASNPKTNIFPQGEPNFAYVYCKLPNGTAATVTDSITKGIEKRVAKVIGEKNDLVSSVISNVGLGAGDPQNPDKVPTPHKSKVTVAFVQFDQRKGKSTQELLDKLKEEFAKGVSGAEMTVEPESNGPPVGKPINVEISGDDFAELNVVAEKVKVEFNKAGIKGYSELKSDLQISKPEIIVQLDKEKMQREGISLAQAAGELRTALYGKEVSKYRDKDKDAPIIIRLDAKYRSKMETLLNLNISFMDMSIGAYKQIPLSAISTIKYDNSVSMINRKNQKRILNLTAEPSKGYEASTITNAMKEVVKSMDKPIGYDVKMVGEQEQQEETTNFLGVAFGGALALMFLILVTQFNSVAKPLIIFTTVVFSIIGIMLGFTFTGMTFSIVMTGVGLFALAGIVVRNGILMIEFIDELKERGLSLQEAVIEGGATRMTPVILTAMSAILGLIPLAIGLNMDFATMFSEFNPHFFIGGDNVAFWGPLAWTMIFGLIFATFLTLVLVPLMVLMVERASDKIFKRN